jgi:Protein of unknown function (DUF3667)
VWQLLIPGKVTTEYFKGRIKRYPHPVQFFFVVMFFFLLLVHKAAEERGGFFKINLDNPNKTKKEVSTDELLGKYAAGVELTTNYKKLPDSLKSSVTEKAVIRLANMSSHGLDTLLGVGFGDTTVLDSLPMLFAGKHEKLAVVDIAQMPYPEICANYGVTDWDEKLLLTQLVKSMRESRKFANTIISSLTWTLLVMSAFMAWMLYLFFRKRRPYYVEHFIFMLHYFSGAFLLLTLLLAVNQYIVELPPVVWAIGAMLLGIGLFSAIYRFYQTSLWKTIGVWMLFNFIGMFAFSFIFIFGMFAVFIIY